MHSARRGILSCDVRLALLFLPSGIVKREGFCEYVSLSIQKSTRALAKTEEETRTTTSQSTRLSACGKWKKEDSREDNRER